METLSDLKRLYEQDFVAWCEATVARLKAGQLDAIDIENLIEEIESLGRREGLKTGQRPTPGTQKQTKSIAGPPTQTPVRC